MHNITVMRRKADDWLNATQFLKVAGVEKAKRTRYIERELFPQIHEKVQGGYGAIYSSRGKATRWKTDQHEHPRTQVNIKELGALCSSKESPP